MEKTLSEAYVKVIKEQGWSVVGCDEQEIELETWSPAGENLCICVSTAAFPQSVTEYYEDFDPDTHVEELIVARRNGFQDVPKSIRDLVDDAEAIDEMLRDLAYALTNVEVEDSEGDEDEDEGE